MVRIGKESRCCLIQAYLTATPSRNTPLLFLGFHAPARPALAAFRADDFPIRVARVEPCHLSANSGQIASDTTAADSYMEH